MNENLRGPMVMVFQQHVRSLETKLSHVGIQTLPLVDSHFAGYSLTREDGGQAQYGEILLVPGVFNVPSAHIITPIMSSVTGKHAPLLYETMLRLNHYFDGMSFTMYPKDMGPVMAVASTVDVLQLSPGIIVSALSRQAGAVHLAHQLIAAFPAIQPREGADEEVMSMLVSQFI